MVVRLAYLAALLAQGVALTPRTRLRMASTEVSFSAGKLLSNEAATKASESPIRRLRVDLGGVADSYTMAGQYVQMRQKSGEKAGFYALASAPGSGSEVEFLVKEAESNKWLIGAKPGAKVEVSAAAGNGFKVAENLDDFVKFDFPVQNLLLFAAGTGIAPIKAAIESKTLRLDQGRECKLYYGARNVDSMAFTEDFEKWKDLGVTVIPCFSQGSAASSLPEARTGYVQHALEEDGVAIPRNSGALLCGMKGMTEAVKTILTSAGVFPERCLLNF